MCSLLVFAKLFLFGLLLEKSFGNIEDEASKYKNIYKNDLKRLDEPGKNYLQTFFFA